MKIDSLKAELVRTNEKTMTPDRVFVTVVIDCGYPISPADAAIKVVEALKRGLPE